MADAAKNEPSMDDILSSIRKIVSQDDRRTGVDRRITSGQQKSESPDTSGPGSNSAAEQTKPETPRQHTRRSDDRDDGLNLASLAGMVRGQQPRAENIDTERANPSTTPEGLQARQQVPPVAAPPQRKPETPPTLADLQRTVSSHFNPAPTKASAQTPEEVRPELQTGAKTGTATPSIPAGTENPATPDHHAPSVPPKRAMTLKDLAEQGASASVSVPSPSGDIAPEVKAPSQTSDSTIAPSTQAPSHPVAKPPEKEPAIAPVGNSPAPAAIKASDADDETDQDSEVEAGAFREALVAPATQSAVGSSIDRLKKSVMDDLEARVESVLRPMLREWLDDNLPAIVENAVRQEIERIARQG